MALDIQQKPDYETIVKDRVAMLRSVAAKDLTAEPGSGSGGGGGLMGSGIVVILMCIMLVL